LKLDFSISQPVFCWFQRPETCGRLTFGNKRQRKPKGQSRMDNPGKLATLGTQDTGRRQAIHKNITQHRKLKRLRRKTQPKPVGELSCTRRVSSSRFLRHSPCYSYI